MLTKMRMLRMLLLAAGLGWGLTIIGVFLPWHWAVEHLQKFGGSGMIPDDVMLNYWMRMASGAFALVGAFFLLAAWKPLSYKNIIPVLAYGSIFEGVILLFYGIKFELPLFPFGPDVAIALIPGIGILLLQGELNDNQSSQDCKS